MSKKAKTKGPFLYDWRFSMNTLHFVGEKKWGYTKYMLDTHPKGLISPGLQNAIILTTAHVLQTAARPS